MKTNATLNQQQKQHAISLMHQLDIYKPYIDDFEKENTVCFFEHFAGFWAYQDETLNKKIKEIEEEFGCLVYAVTHEFTEFGECYSMLIISKYKEEWSRSIVKDGNTYYCFAYVWNKTVDYFSEFGTVGVKSGFGGITRVS